VNSRRSITCKKSQMNYMVTGSVVKGSNLRGQGNENGRRLVQTRASHGEMYTDIKRGSERG